MSILSHVVAIIDAAQYFDASPERPAISLGAGTFTITLLIHVGINRAEMMLRKGPQWAADPRHP